MISNNKIRYDLFYEYRKEELKPYMEIVQILTENKNTTWYMIDEKTISMVRTIVSGQNVNALVISEKGTYTIDIKGVRNVVSYKDYGKDNWKYISIAPSNIYIQPVTYILSNLLTSVLINILVGLILISNFIMAIKTHEIYCWFMR